jgi:hypothetical protein
MWTNDECGAFSGDGVKLTSLNPSRKKRSFKGGPIDAS